MSIPEHSVIQFKLPIIVCTGCMDVRSREGEEPANIGRRDKMPGGTHDVRAKKSAIGKGLLNVVVRHALQAQAERPFCSRKILSLDSTQPLHESLRCFKRSPRDVLVVKP